LSRQGAPLYDADRNIAPRMAELAADRMQFPVRHDRGEAHALKKTYFVLELHLPNTT
jgi:hypothetical protein